MQISFELLNLKYQGLTLITTAASIACSNTFLKGGKKSKNYLFKYMMLQCSTVQYKFGSLQEATVSDF